MKNGIIRAGRTARHEALRLVSALCILLFAILPLLTLAFHITGEDWQFMLADPAFGEALDRAAEAGVRILCLPCHVEPDRLEIVSGKI